MVAERRTGIALIIPALLFIFSLILYPFLYNTWLSLRNVTSTRLDAEFVGLAQYVRLLKDPLYLKATKLTFVWTFGVVAGQLLVGFPIALLLNAPLVGRGICRGLLLIPYTISEVVAVFSWKWLLNDVYGIVNYFLTRIGVIEEPIIFLGSGSTAMATAIGIGIWQAVPLAVLMLLAGLQTIPQDLYDAARVDGANFLHEVWYITLPSLRRVIQALVLIKSIWTFNWFTLIWLLTGGGPAYGTRILPVLVYVLGFRMFRLSKASAISVTMLLYLVAIIVVFLRVTATQED